jgi:hypothetical protein
MSNSGSALVEHLPHHVKIEGSSPDAADDTCDLYYYHVTIVNYASSCIIYDFNGRFYNCNMLIVQATGVIGGSWT